MSNFNKPEYDKLYNSTNRKRYSWNLSNEEYDRFLAYCTNINIKPSAYLKKLVNADAGKRGYGTIFGRRKKTDSQKDM